jgi:integrase
MAGSMRQRRAGIWELRVYVGRDDEGRIRHVNRTVRGGKRDAGRELARLQAAVMSEGIGAPAAPRARRSPVTPVAPSMISSPEPPAGEALPDPEPRAIHRGRTRPRDVSSHPAAFTASWGPETTINDAIAAWKANGWADLSPSTVRRYQNNWDVHIRYGIGEKRIVDLGPYDIEQYLRRLKARGLAEASVRQVRAILHRSCRLARKWSNQALPNPVADTEMPGWSLDEQGAEVRAPSADEVRALIAAGMEWDLRIGVFVRVIAATGARRGEVAALRWSDVDFDGGQVRIDESVVADNGGAKVKSPKTRAGIRSLAVDAGTIGELVRLRKDRDELAEAVGAVLGPDCFVFASEPDGVAPPHPDYFSHAFDRVRTAAGVPKDIHLHSLRHFQSTELDSVISEAQKQTRLGWATVKMARHYTDAVTTEDRRAADHIGTLLSAESSEEVHRAP